MLLPLYFVSYFLFSVSFLARFRKTIVSDLRKIILRDLRNEIDLWSTIYNSTNMGDQHLSKCLAKLLRHDALKERLNLSPEGYVDVEEVLQLSRISRYSEQDVEDVVLNDRKSRFKIRTHSPSGKRQIKATQGHSIQLDSDTDLTPINHHTDARVVLHGTKSSLWRSIESQGLKRMKRTHIHFAPGEHAKSGFPPGCDIAIEIDLKKALEGGLKFYKSANGVILSPGNTSGTVSPRYFKRAYNIRTHDDLL